MTKKIILISTSVFFVSLTLIISCKPNRETVVPSLLEQGEELSGGESTIFDESINAFGHAIAGLTSNENTDFVVGNSFFRDNWVVAPSSTTGRDGLGPMINSNSCSGCHFKDGRGRSPLEGERLKSMLLRLSVPGTDIHGGPVGDENYGGQLSTSAIPGVLPEGEVIINYLDIIGNYDDGEKYTLKKPLYQFVNLNYGSLNSSIMFSPRVAQQMPGLGFLEAITESTIISFSDENDVNNDGISGRINFVWDVEKNSLSIGRFGWKANQPNLRQQTAGAFLGDMGITSSIFPTENMSAIQKINYPNLINGGTPEISDKLLNQVIFYVATLAVPGRRNWTDATVLKGKQLFQQANCNGCHKEKMITGMHPTISKLSNQTIRPFTDLLLHDMGPGLADDRPDYLATGQEWRTPPLWGIGMIKTVNNHTQFLHDGRARNLTEAILWHGGEAQKSQKAFKSMSKLEREALLKFLESL